MTEEVFQGRVVFGLPAGGSRARDIASIWLEGGQTIASGGADVIAFDYTNWDPSGFVTTAVETFGANTVPIGAGFAAIRAGMYLPSATMLFRLEGPTLDTEQFNDIFASTFTLITKWPVFFGFLELYVNGDLRWGRDFRVTGAPLLDYAFMPVAYTGDPLELAEGDVVYLRCTNDSYVTNQGGADLFVQGGSSPSFVASRFAIEYLGPVPSGS